MYSTLVSVTTVREHLQDPAWRIVDCRFDLTDKAAGISAWRAGHIPGAIHADLDQDLSGPPLTDRGRHPLPAPEKLEETCSRLGISNDMQVLVYDQVAGSFAGRLWWLLRYMGHEAVAVMDGGWQAWLAAGYPVTMEQAQRPAALFRGRPRREWVVHVAEVPDARLLIDARDPARYRGEVEPLDPRAGHIPGAINRCWRENLGTDGCFKPAAALRAEYTALLGATAPAEAVYYCGSGVTACHDILAQAYAGLPMPKLYAGSWSDWCSSPERPVAVGAEP